MFEGYPEAAALGLERKTPSDLRREWDLNPRWAGPTTVFETVRFGRSRIPPSTSVPGRLLVSGGSAPAGEERFEEGGRLGGAHAVGDRDLVIEPRIGA